MRRLHSSLRSSPKPPKLSKGGRSLASLIYVAYFHPLIFEAEGPCGGWHPRNYSEDPSSLTGDTKMSVL
jgi:hypothetical protein